MIPSKLQKRSVNYGLDLIFLNVIFCCLLPCSLLILFEVNAVFGALLNYSKGNEIIGEFSVINCKVAIVLRRKLSESENLCNQNSRAIIINQKKKHLWLLCNHDLMKTRN